MYFCHFQSRPNPVIGYARWYVAQALFYLFWTVYKQASLWLPGGGYSQAYRFDVLPTFYVAKIKYIKALWRKNNCASILYTLSVAPTKNGRIMLSKMIRIYVSTPSMDQLPSSAFLGWYKHIGKTAFVRRNNHRKYALSVVRCRQAKVHRKTHICLSPVHKSAPWRI